MKTIIYYYRGGVERGTGTGYVWRDGFSELSADGLTLYPFMTKRECRHEAKTRGCKAAFVWEAAQ